MAAGYLGYLILLPFIYYLYPAFRVYFSRTNRNLRADRAFARLLEDKREIRIGLYCRYFSREQRLLRAARSYDRRHGVQITN